MEAHKRSADTLNPEIVVWHYTEAKKIPFANYPSSFACVGFL
jgi:hypothetical protein